MTDRPIAIDLFCGLFQTKFINGADAPIKQFVTRWTKNPDHMWLSVRNEPPSPVAFVRWTVGYFKDAILTARLAGARHVRPSSSKSIECNILEVSILFVGWPTFLVLSCCPLAAKISRSFVCAFDRTIALIGAWWFDGEMLPAPPAILAFFRDSLMFVATDSSCSLRTVVAAPFFVRAKCFECSPTPLT